MYGSPIAAGGQLGSPTASTFFYRDGDDFPLLDTISRAARNVLTIPHGSEYNDFSVSADGRAHMARDTEEGDIWLLTVKWVSRPPTFSASRFANSAR